MKKTFAVVLGLAATLTLGLAGFGTPPPDVPPEVQVTFGTPPPDVPPEVMLAFGTPPPDVPPELTVA